MSSSSAPAYPVTYCPPPSELIDQYVHAACAQLGDTIDEDYASPEVVRGLAAFLKVVASAYANALNNPNSPSLDNPSS